MRNWKFLMEKVENLIVLFNGNEVRENVLGYWLNLVFKSSVN